jgi:hypothetical protein
MLIEPDKEGSQIPFQNMNDLTNYGPAAQDIRDRLPPRGSRPYDSPEIPFTWDKRKAPIGEIPDQPEIA